MQKKQQQLGVPWMSRLQCLLRECIKRKDVHTGTRLHGLMVTHRLDTVDLFGDLLILFYTQCGKLQEAHHCFRRIIIHGGSTSVHTWNLIISAHLKLGSGHMVFHLYTQMNELECITPNRTTFVSTLRACVESEFLGEGMLLHSQMLQCNVDHMVDSDLASSLISFYSRFGCVADAECVFDAFHARDRDVILLGSMIYAYVEHGFDHSSIELFEGMLRKGLEPSHFILKSMMKACKSCVAHVLKMHDQIVRSGYESDIVIGSSLVDVYAKLGEFDGASKVFKGLSNQDVVLWGALIGGHTHHGHGHIALELFNGLMNQTHLNPDMAILLSIVLACTQVRNGSKGRIIHGLIVENDLELNVAIGSSLIRMYATCGCLLEAHQIFDSLQDRDIISWGAIMAGYMEHGQCQRVINLYSRMQDEDCRHEVDRVVLMNLLGACSGIGDITLGRKIHDQVMIWNDVLLFDDVDVGNAFVNMYVKCGSLKDARCMFDHIPTRNLVAWGAMIAGYVQEGNISDAFKLFNHMLDQRIEPDEGLYACIFKACTLTGVARKLGSLLHDRVIRNGFDNISIVSNAIIYMYGSCESLREARKVLDNMANKDVISWSSLITGLALNGNNVIAEKLLVDMRLQGLTPDDTLYATLMSSYTHRGLVEESIMSFKKMGDIQTTYKLYNSLVDLFSRTGHLLEAKDLLQTMPSLPDEVVCMSLLTNSKTYGHYSLWKTMFESNVCRAEF